MTLPTSNVDDFRGKIDIGIITIREDEYQAVLDRLPTETLSNGRQIYSISKLKTSDGGEIVTALVRCLEQGNTPAQSATYNLIEDLNPRWLAVVGIAGSVPEFEHTLGDVLVASRLQDFSVSAQTETGQEFDIRGGAMHPEVQKLVAALPAIEPHLERWNTVENLTVDRPEVQVVSENFSGDDSSWNRKIEQSLESNFGEHSTRKLPKAFSGSMASSDRLIKDTALIQQWLRTARQVRGIDMESAGIYQAAISFQKPVLIVRGISDIVGFKRSHEWTNFACHSAASFFVALLKGYAPFFHIDSLLEVTDIQPESRDVINVENNINTDTLISGEISGNITINYNSPSDLAKEIKSHIDESFKHLVPSADIDSSPQVKEKVHLAEVDFAVSLLREGKVETALSRLKNLRENLEEGSSDNLQFRVTANIGICYFQLDNLEEARTEFISALVFKPQDELIRSNLSLVFSLLGDNEKALHYAVKPSPEYKQNSIVASNYLRVLSKAGLNAEIASLLESEKWIEQDPNCALSLGLIKFNEGHYEESEKYFRIAREKDTDNPHSLRLLAQSILVPINQMILGNPPLHLPETIQRRLEEAKNYLDKAIEVFEKHEGSSSFFYSLLQRASIQEFLGNLEAALADCEQLLRIKPDNDEAIHHKAQILLSSDRIEEALQWFDKLQGERTRNEALLAIALAYSRTKNFNKVVDLLHDKVDLLSKSRQQATLIDLLLHAYHNLELAERKSELIQKLREHRSDDPEILSVIAGQFLREEKAAYALKYYKKALSKAAQGNQALRIKIELADAYHYWGKWKKAAELYEGNVEESIDRPITRRYVSSLYNSGARDKAFEIAKSIRTNGNIIPFYIGIEAEILNVLGRYEEAALLYKQLTELEPEKTSHCFALAEMYRRLGKADLARSIIESIDYDEIKNDTSSLLLIAELRQKLEMRGDLPFAYQARRIGRGDERVHHAYLQLFFNHTKRESGDLDVDSIKVDHSVYLKDKHGETVVYHILDEDNCDVSKGEIHTTNPRAEKLLGLRVGDNVTFNEGEPNEVQYEITEIKNKYVDAFQESITKHEEWFGDSSNGIMVMNVAEGDFSSFFKMLAKQGERNELLFEYFNSGRLPLVTFAQFAGKNLFETWSHLINSSDVQIIVSSASTEESKNNLQIVKNTNEIVVDLSGLLTLCWLGLLDKLPQAFSRILVSNSVSGTLKDFFLELENTEPHPTVWGYKGEYFRSEVTEDVINDRKNFIATLNSFIEQYAEVLPAAEALTIPSDDLKQYYEIFGPSFSSILLAYEYNLPVYLDDYLFYQVSKTRKWKVNGISIQAVLSKFQALGLISQVEYWSSLKKMMLGNYASMLLDIKALWWMCRDEKLQATENIRKILLIAFGHQCNDYAAITIGAHLIYRMYLEVGDQTEKIKLIDLALNAIFKDRNSEFVTTRLKNVLSLVTRYSPKAEALIYDRIDAHLEAIK